MITNLRDLMAENPPMEVGRLIKLMGIAIIEDQYQALVDKALSKLPNFVERKTLLHAGFFLGSDLAQLMHEIGPASGISVQVVSSLLNQLIEWMLVSDSGILIPNGYVRYQWNKQRIAMFIGLKCLDNILLGPSYIAQKYHQSVPPIFVTKNGDKHTGTGFLATNRIDTQRFVILTARHNIDPEAGIVFNEIGSIRDISYTPLLTNWVLHPQLVDKI